MTAAGIATSTASSHPTEKQSGVTLTLLGILVAVLALVGAALAFGPVVLTLAALTLVPVMFVLFIAISRP